jgi:hypothetical protein
VTLSGHPTLLYWMATIQAEYLSVSCRGAYNKMVNRMAHYQLSRAFSTWMDSAWEAQQHQVPMVPHGFA